MAPLASTTTTASGARVSTASRSSPASSGSCEGGVLSSGTAARGCRDRLAASATCVSSLATVVSALSGRGPPGSNEPSPPPTLTTLARASHHPGRLDAPGIPAAGGTALSLAHPRRALREPPRGEPRQHDPHRRAPDDRAGPARLLEPTPVDRRRVRARVRRPPAHARQPRRPDRSQDGVHGGARPVRRRLHDLRLRLYAGPVDRGPGVPRDRRRRDHA